MQKSFRETARYLASLISLWTATHPDRIGIAQAILLPHIPRLSARHACRGREPQTTMASGLRADGEELQRLLLVGEHGSDSDGAAKAPTARPCPILRPTWPSEKDRSPAQESVDAV